MGLVVFLFLLLVCLFLLLARLGGLDWLHLRPASSQGVAKRIRLPLYWLLGASVPKNVLMMTIPPIFPPSPNHGQGFPGTSFPVRHETDIPSSQYRAFTTKYR